MPPDEGVSLRGSVMRRRSEALGQWSAEALGSALLVLGACLPEAPQGAVAAGLTVAALVQCFDHISGAMFNPTVTLAALVMGRLPPRRALLLVGAQLVGATAAGAALGAFGRGGCVTRPAAHVPPSAAAALEALLGGVLALANCAAWDPRTAQLRQAWPLRIGCVVAALAAMGGELTGASMNPARSLGPAICARDFQHHWVYWVGPLGGGLGAALLYRGLWAPSPLGAPPGAPLGPPIGPPPGQRPKSCAV